MDVVWSGLAFVVLLTLLVILHELGHFVAARLSGVRVEEFGFGLPPRLTRLFWWRGTLFSLNWIPFGGFVRLQGEDSADPDERHRAGSFANASIASRLWILAAGVGMNFLLALMLFFMGFWIWGWVPTYFSLDDLRAAEQRGEVAVEWGLYISDSVPGTPAARARVATGVVLTEIDGEPIRSVDDLLTRQQRKQFVTYTLRSGDQYQDVEKVRISVVQGKTGIVVSTRALSMTADSRSLLQAVVLSGREVFVATKGTIKGMAELFSSLIVTQTIPDGITGVVGIAQMTHDSLKQGWMRYLRLVAILSLSLAVLNILPFPALDGGRMAFVLYELCVGRPMNRRFEVVINSIGILLIMLLMAVVTWNDIVRIFSNSSLL